MYTKPAMFALIAALGMACTEYEVRPDDDLIEDITESGAPDIEVDPGAIEFGAVEVNENVEQVEVVTISNVGEAPLHINNIELENPESPFSISAIQSVMISPGQYTQFEVTFEPGTAEANTTYILIDSDDPDTPTAEVLLSGEGIAPIIEIDPQEYDFGTVYVGCENLLDINISNVGNADLVIEPDGIEFVTGSTDLVLIDVDEELYPDVIAEDGTITLASGALNNTMAVQVSYAPLDDYDDVAYLRVTSNDPFTPEAQAKQTGAGEIYGTNVDVFEQPIEGSTDIVFALDKSGSMSDDLALVSTNFGVFVTTLSGMDADYQVTAVVQDDGCVYGPDKWIDSTFSESEAVASMSTMISGSYGSNTERAFMLLEAALSEDNLDSGGCNEGLIRDDAKLNLVCVSDEREQSVNSWEYYVSLFQSMKDDPDDVIIHAIGGDYPSGCGSAEAYDSAYQATTATGGLFLSICATDWASHLEILAEGAAANLTTFALTQEPVPETISVTIDGVTSTVGWEYNEPDNSVDFETDYVPEGGSTIEVSYVLFGNCEG